MNRANHLISLFLVFAMVSASLLPLTVLARGESELKSGTGAQPVSDVDENSKEDQQGLSFRLSQGVDQPESLPVAKVTTSTTLSDDETATVLRRLPPIKAEPNDEADFALRDRSLPPPRTGKTINAAFPPATEITSPAVAASPLQVLRFAPEGPVPLAANLIITFSQPMVAVSSQETASKNVPVRVSPQPQGRWRWIGTRTLQFDPDGRFPMATSYSVTVPAGTRSATGSELSASTSWNFTTPAPTVKSTFPEKDGKERGDTLLFVAFDQRIDPAAVIKTIRLSAGNLQMKARLATSEEIKANKEVSKLAQLSEAGRWLAFRAVSSTSNHADVPLPSGARVTVSVGPGTPSAEGPRLSAKAQTFSFHIHGPLRVIKHECDAHQVCDPSDSFDIKFSNPLDAAAFQPSQVKVEPAIEKMKTAVFYNTLTINGVMKSHTVYRVTLDPSIKDTLGQSLGSTPPVVFSVRGANPVLFTPQGSFAVLDPYGPAKFPIYSVNYSSLRVQLYSVGPEDYSKWLEFPRRTRTLPGKLAFSKTIAVAAKPDEMIETPIDLDAALKDGYGQIILRVDPLPRRQDDRAVETWLQRTNIGLDAFVDQTNLVGWATSLKDGAPLSGVQMRLLPHGVVGTTGADGAVRLALGPEQPKAVNLLVASRGSDLAILPEHVDRWTRDGSWFRNPPGDTLRWYVFDDRRIYRPGEEVHIKGWIRRLGGDSRGDVSAPGDAVTATDVLYTLKDSRGNEIVKAGTRLSALGGFNVTLKLPSTMNLGDAHVDFLTNSKLTGASFTHSFDVEEFRRPEFEVTTKSESAGPHVVGASADLSVSANYYSGGGLADAAVQWQVSSRPGTFTPPNRGDFTFGKWLPWWGSSYDPESRNQFRDEQFAGKTDSDGKHRLHIDFDSVKPARPSSVTVEASVTDVNRQEWTSSTTLLVHPADLYVGLRSPKTFVAEGESLVVESIVTDLDGRAIADREIKMRAVLLDWVQEQGEWKQVETKPQECSILSASEVVKCSFKAGDGGQYRMVATILDDRGRRNESELTLWVAGGKQPPAGALEQETVKLIPDRKEYKSGETAEILIQAPFFPAEAMLTLRRSGILKSEQFRLDGPTHTLRLPIEAEWTPNVYVQVDLVGAADPQASKLKGTEEAVGRMPAVPGKRPAFASGSLNLSIPPLDRKLTVTATPRDVTLEPGGETKITVQVSQANGASVNGSEVAVVVVDESVLALTNYQLADPLSIFYSQRGADTRDTHLRKDLLLMPPLEEKEQFIQEFWRRAGGGGPGGGGGGGMFMRKRLESLPLNGRNYTAFSLLMPARVVAEYGSSAGAIVNFVTKSGTTEPDPAIHLRDTFNALAVFAPAVRTDANGHAEVQVKLPDNLTRYRVMAVAVSGGKQFGSGESAITARMPLMVRPSAPRFLNFGDKFELPIVVQNQTDQPLTVDLAVRAANATLSEPPAVAGGSRVTEPNTSERARPLSQAVLTGRRVIVPANDRVEVRFPTATAKPGIARFQIAAASGRLSDAAEIELPVWTPATTEAFATYGELDEGAIVQEIKAPADVFKQVGGLEIETSATQLQQLTDAVLYLTHYPYECSEQLSSRIIAIAALRDVLAAFKSRDLPAPPVLEAAVARDLKRLQGMQNTDGGFGFWNRGDESWPYLSIHGAHALARARQKKFDVPAEMLERSRKYLRGLESHIPSRYGPTARNALIAYALYTRAQLGERDTLRARRLIAEAGLENLSLESAGWLLSVLSGDPASKIQIDAIHRLLNNRASETAGTAHFVSSYKDSDYLLLNSDRRADGIILEALINDRKPSDLIPKIVRGLMDHRTRGRWGNTQENVFILLALDRYFNAYEKVTPNFVARVWLGDRYAGEQEFKGHSTDRQQLAVPMSYLADQGSAQNLILNKEGPGRLYYRLGLNYAPQDLNLKSADYGFTVERAYEAVDHSDDVQRDADGTWRIKAGARVRVRLTMVAPARRYHVALVDPLPAGLEALNPSLAVTESIPEDKEAASNLEPQSNRAGNGRWWRSIWFDHQNLRDDRAEAFTSLLWDGVYNYSYVARATTPGVFVVPPVKAEEMYHPETFGRGKTDRVKIE